MDGNNDVLGYATTGGDDPITPLQVYLVLTDMICCKSLTLVGQKELANIP
jgi:hypothetical protein